MPIPTRLFRVRHRRERVVLLLFSCLLSLPALASAPAAMPDTPVGVLGNRLIQHINSDSPEQLARWVPSILSSSIDNDERAAFIRDMTLAGRDSQGIDVFDVRTDSHQPGLLEVAVRARHGGRCALLLLTVDAVQPGKLLQADAVPMDSPELYAAWPKGAVSSRELVRLIRMTLDTLTRTQDFSGCLTVVRGGATLFDECRGSAERNFDVPTDHRTKFHIGSMNKMFTAVAIAQLIEGGKLSWNSTLAQLVPEYPDQETAKVITVAQLLHHTAGLGDFLVPEFFEHREKFSNPADYLDLIARQPKVGEPGKQWMYSNAGYMLLGRVIENASGETYFEYIKRHIFVPAAMLSSGFDDVDDITPRLAVGYYREGLFSSDWKAYWLKAGFKGGPAGGGYYTNADLINFATALRTGHLVKPATLDAMFTDEVPAGPGSYAAGFGDRPSHGMHIRGHAGGIEGTSANLAIVWETGDTVTITSNEGESNTAMLFSERIADQLALERSNSR